MAEHTGPIGPMNSELELEVEEAWRAYAGRATHALGLRTNDFSQFRQGYLYARERYKAGK